MSRSGVTHAVRLGLRLAWGVSGAARLRALAVGVVALVSTVLLLSTAALTRATWGRLHEGWSPQADLPLRLDDAFTVLLLALTVTLSVGTLVATVGQLAVRLREQRLANLRLLGMAPGQTRVLAVVEAGTFVVVGWLAGELLFALGRPLLALVRLGGEPYAVEQLTPHLLDHVVTALVVPGLVIAQGLLRRSRSAHELVQAGRWGEGPRPQWWRVVPLAVGAAACGWLIRHTAAARETGHQVPASTGLLVLLVVGLLLCAVGMLLVVPVFVRLVADLFVRAGGRPALLVAGRRLQAQPAAMTRVVSALLIALFLATSSLAILAAYRSTPQFERVDRMVMVEQSTELSAAPGQVSAIVARAEAVEGVRSASPVHHAVTDCVERAVPEESLCGTWAWVGTCDDLRAAVPAITGCRGDVVQEIGYGRWVEPSSPAPEELTLWARGFELELPDPGTGGSDYRVEPPHGPSAVVPLPSGEPISVPEWGAVFFGGAVFVPSSLPGVQDLLPALPAQVRVVSGPGRDLFDDLSAAGLQPGTWEEFSDYDRVIWMGQLVTGLSALFVCLGILSFGLSALDQALARRREVVSLQLVGAPGRVLRASQWWEVALPLLLGCGLAIWLGSLVGGAFLGLTLPDRTEEVALVRMWPALVAAAAGSLLVGVVTSVAANPRIRAELIRRE